MLTAVTRNEKKKHFVLGNIFEADISSTFNGMKSVVQSIIKVPEGTQMALMTNEHGLNAREMAVHAGNLEMAKLLKDSEFSEAKL